MLTDLDRHRTHRREGSRPRGPLFSKFRAYPVERLITSIIATTAREDARPPDAFHQSLLTSH
jgi:hypothetical protein